MFIKYILWTSKSTKKQTFNLKSASTTQKVTEYATSILHSRLNISYYDRMIFLHSSLNILC